MPGKWWRCRECQWYSLRSATHCCNWNCKAAKQVPGSANLSQQLQNQMQPQHKPGQGKAPGNAGSKKGRNRWAKGSTQAAQQSSPSQQSSPVGADADEEMGVKDDLVSQAKAELAMYEAMLSSLAKCSGKAAEEQRSSLQGKMQDAKRRITAAKPLDQQQKVLASLVARREVAVEKARSQLVEAQATLEEAEAAHAEASLQLKAVHLAMEEEEEELEESPSPEIMGKLQQMEKVLAMLLKVAPAEVVQQVPAELLPKSPKIHIYSTPTRATRRRLSSPPEGAGGFDVPVSSASPSGQDVYWEEAPASRTRRRQIRSRSPGGCPDTVRIDTLSPIGKLYSSTVKPRARSADGVDGNAKPVFRRASNLFAPY